ncbi:MAG: multicopper oxidase domain-containing protein [bacterium]|nr:multicopper oxidase domain-containing protein [bacterium]
MNNRSVVIGIIILVIISGGIIYSIKQTRDGYVTPPSKTVETDDISRKANTIPGPITRKENTKVVVNLEARQVVAEIAPGTTYEYWTYNGTVPGPFIRVKEGDTVEVRLAHVHADSGSHASQDFPHSFSVDNFSVAVAEADAGHNNGTNEMPMNTGDGHAMSAEDATHEAEGHGEHSIDLHSVMGPGGGAMLSKTKPDETTVFQFKAQRAGLFIYHCASPHIPTHIANGMYGMILVEPQEGLRPVDKEFYVMQADMYTKGLFGQKGHQELDLEKLKNERPEYFVFNGRVGGVAGENAIHVKAGETVRIFFGVGTHIASNFHIIGGIFDRLYPEGDIISPPHRNVQTTIVPPGGSAMIETTFDVPGKYLLVDHSLSRAIDKGALGEIIVEGVPRPDVFNKIQ